MESRQSNQLSLAIIIIAMVVPILLPAQGFDYGTEPFDAPPWPGFDQARLQKPRAGNQRGRMRQPQHMDPARMRERVNAMKIWKLTEYLELTEEQAGPFFARLRVHEDEAAEINRRKKQLYREFQEQIDKGGVKSKDVDRYLEETAKLEQSHIELRTQHIQSMEDILTEEQMAKFAVFQERFRRELRYQLQDEIAPRELDQEDN
jgi:Spy/CpxP family protein refolding chaperone